METVKELRDPEIFPSDDVIEAVLGKSGIYSSLKELLDGNGITYEWIYYNDVKSWLCKATRKNKTIIWISVWTGYIKATIYIPEKAIEGICGLEISEETKSSIRETKNTGKSKGCTFNLKNTNQLKDFNAVMQYKMSLK